MSGPANASLTGDGFRFYRWEPAEGGEPTDVLSVTSIRKLCGESFNLVNWQLANIADAALGTMKRTIIGPRGGVTEKRLIEEYPSEFARLYAEADGEQTKIDGLRKWLREQADEPRNMAAIRGTIVHEAIEKNIEWDRIARPYVESAFMNLSMRDKKRAKKGVQDEDILFVRHAVRQYWDVRKHVPFVIITREPQVFNLTAGYAGSTDALVWLVPEGWPDGRLPRGHEITLRWVIEEGGGVDQLVLIDWKTSKGIYTDQVVQAHAYMAAEFVGSNGIKDDRLTDLVRAVRVGGLVHIRPNQWAVHMFDFNAEVLRAFLGSVAFARFLAKYPEPNALFSREYKGSAPEEE
jgi:hypothetical protein